MPAERRLAAIMFTDMVGYTRLAQKDESRALRALEDQRRILRPIVSKYRGREVKTIGDAHLIEFESALNATNCALDIQNHLHTQNLSSKDKEKITLRIGIHLGDVVRRKTDILGDAVNVASRVEPLAEAGGICVSGQVFDQVRNKISSPLVKLSPRDLKNVRFAIDVYKIVMPWEDSARASESPEVSRTRRIAVLPFTNMSPDPSDEYFADGMTEEVISALSKIERAEVISRTSVMGYKKQAKSVKEVSAELDVGTVLEGSVRKAGNKLRITVQMIDARRDRHLWVESYDRDLADVFAIQTDIARRVAEALQVRISKEGIAVDDSTPSVDAYTMYLRAVQLHHENTEQSLRESVALFEKTILKEPRFVRAYAGLAHALCGLATGGYADFTSSVQKAEAIARKALELGPDSADAYLALAYVHTYLDKFDDVIFEAEKAIQINPNLGEAYRQVGWIYSSMGRLEDGVQNLEKAGKLDPLSFRPGSEVSLVYQLAGKERMAQDFLEKSRDLYPRNQRVYARWAEFYMIKRDYAKAQEMLDMGLPISPKDIDLLADQGVLHLLTGKKREAQEVLNVIMGFEIEDSRLQGTLFIRAAQGNFDEAFKVLMRMAETHSWPPLVKSLPVFEEMRKDPRFSKFCLNVGLPA